MGALNENTSLSVGVDYCCFFDSKSTLTFKPLLTRATVDSMYKKGRYWRTLGVRGNVERLCIGEE